MKKHHIIAAVMTLASGTSAISKARLSPAKKEPTASKGRKQNDKN
jgi:hypothetical protein